MSEPARLYKADTGKQNKFDCMDTIEAWVLSHASLCLFVCFAFLIALFVVLLLTLTGVSATESGIVYNQFNNIV